MTGTAPGEGLLDTRVVLLLSAIEDPEAMPVFPHASVVTLAELSVGPLVARSDAR